MPYMLSLQLKPGNNLQFRYCYCYCYPYLTGKDIEKLWEVKTFAPSVTASKWQGRTSNSGILIKEHTLNHLAILPWYIEEGRLYVYKRLRHTDYVQGTARVWSWASRNSFLQMVGY